jgi:hypothetical protein
MSVVKSSAAATAPSAALKKAIGKVRIVKVFAGLCAMIQERQKQEGEEDLSATPMWHLCEPWTQTRLKEQERKEDRKHRVAAMRDKLQRLNEKRRKEGLKEL